MLSKPLTLVPAYGRSYADTSEMLQDWQDGKDFKILCGPYTSIRDIEELVATSSSVWIHCLVGGFHVRVA